MYFHKSCLNYTMLRFFFKFITTVEDVWGTRNFYEILDRLSVKISTTTILGAGGATLSCETMLHIQFFRIFLKKAET